MKKIKVTNKTKGVVFLKPNNPAMELFLLEKSHTFKENEIQPYANSVNALFNSGVITVEESGADEAGAENNSASSEASKNPESVAKLKEVKAKLKELEKEFKKSSTSSERKDAIRLEVESLKEEAKSYK